MADSFYCGGCAPKRDPPDQLLPYCKRKSANVKHLLVSYTYAFYCTKKRPLMRSLFIFKKWLCHFLKALRPAAAHALFAVGEQLARLQAEMCFRPRTCRGRKQLKNFVALAAKFCKTYFKTHFFTLDSEIALYFRK